MTSIVNNTNRIQFAIILFMSLIFLSCSSISSLIVDEGLLSSDQINSIDENVIYHLQGSLKFYPEQDCSRVPDVNNPNHYVLSPFETPWNEISTNYPAQFYGSYQFTIEKSNEPKRLSLYLQAQSSSSRVYINGSLAGEVGVFDIKTGKIEERFKTLKVDLPPNNKPIEIVILIANRHYIQGGLDEALFIGESNTITGYQLRQNSYASFVIGTLFTLAVYLLLLFLNNRKQKSHLYLALFSLVMILFLLTMNNYLIMNYIPTLPAQSLMRLGTASYTLSGIFLLLFISSKFKNLIQAKFLLRSFIILCSMATVLSLGLPFGQNINYLLTGMHGITLIGSVYITILYIKAIRRKHYKAWSHLIAWMAFSGAVTADIINALFFTQFGSIASLFPAGIIIFIIGHTHILASSHSRVEEKLRTLTGNFEKELFTRTKLLNKMNNKLQKEVEQDSLTGLFNRTRLNKYKKISNSIMDKMSVLFLDLDNFKIINDTWGHEAGDIVIKEFASLIKEQVRPTDVPIRFGGDEFIVILPDTPAKGAAVLAKRILAALVEKKAFIESLQMVLKAEELHNYNPPLTCSIGISERTDKEPVEELLQMADQALLNAKEDGKNGYVIFTDF